MTPEEQKVLLSHFDDVKAERDHLKEEVAHLKDQVKKVERPIFEFNTGFGVIWSDLVAITKQSEGWHFGLWFLFFMAFGAGGFCAIYSTVQFWTWFMGGK